MLFKTTSVFLFHTDRPSFTPTSCKKKKKKDYRLPAWDPCDLRFSSRSRRLYYQAGCYFTPVLKNVMLSRGIFFFRWAPTAERDVHGLPTSATTKLKRRNKKKNMFSTHEETQSYQPCSPQAGTEKNTSQSPT